MQRLRGFTLIELMIAVAMVAILAAIAMPSYSDYVRRGRVSEAVATLAGMRVKMEQYYQDNKNYGSGGTCATDATASSWNSFAATKYFTFSCATSTVGGVANQGYTVTATGKTGSLTNGYIYTVDYTGSRKTTKYANNTVSANCWLTKNSTSCDN